MLLTLEAVRVAAELLIIAAIMDEVEDRDSALTVPPGREVKELAYQILYLEEDTVMYTMGRYVGAISNAWGHDVGLVFHHMGLLHPNLASVDEINDRVGRVLYRLIMSCWGHGIGIGDDHGDEFEKANSILNRLSGKTMAESPVDFDQHETWTGVFVENHLQQRKHSSEVRVE